MGIGTYSLFCIQTVLGLLFLLRPTLFVWYEPVGPTFGICHTCQRRACRLFPAHEPFLRSVLPWHVLAGVWGVSVLPRCE